MSYAALAELIGVRSRSTARRYAVGLKWPDALIIDICMRRFPRLSLEEMVKRRVRLIKSSEADGSEALR